MSLPTDDQARKALPMWTYLTEFFPDAFLAVVDVAVKGNEQHSPGEPLHWARGKSTDQLNTAARHMFDHSTGTSRDVDGTWHLAKAIWRLSAELQTAIEADRAVVSITAEDIAKRRGDRTVMDAFRRAAHYEMDAAVRKRWNAESKFLSDQAFALPDKLSVHDAITAPWVAPDSVTAQSIEGIRAEAAQRDAAFRESLKKAEYVPKPKPLIDYSFEDPYKPGNGRGKAVDIMDESGLVVGAAGAKE